jgi:hypothetical protein
MSFEQRSNNDYQIFQYEWRFLRDALRGNTKIKSRGTEYLKFPNNLKKTGDNCDNYYDRFLKMTDFPELTTQALNAMLGLAASGENVITPEETLEDSSAMINDFYFKSLREILSMGRVGALIEIDDSKLGVKLLSYKTEDIIDWHIDQKGNVDFAVICQRYETFNEDTLTYDDEYNYLMLRLIDGVYTQELRDKDYNLITARQPRYKGNSLSFVPFYLLTTYNLNDEIRNSPLSPVAHLCLHIYRNVAIWNKLVATKGDPMLLFMGFNQRELENVNFGANNFVSTTTSKSDADAKLIEMQTGAEFVKQKVDHDIALAQAYAGKLLDVGGAKESGESLIQRRLMAEIGLKSIIYQLSQQYTKVLQDLSFIIGNPSYKDVTFSGFDEFSSKIQDVDDLMKASGLTINEIVSKQSLHDRAKDLGITKYSYDEELQRIAQEKNEL